MRAAATTRKTISYDTTRKVASDLEDAAKKIAAKYGVKLSGGTDACNRYAEQGRFTLKGDPESVRRANEEISKLPGANTKGSGAYKKGSQQLRRDWAAEREASIARRTREVAAFRERQARERHRADLYDKMMYGDRIESFRASMEYNFGLDPYGNDIR